MHSHAPIAHTAAMRHTPALAALGLVGYPAHPHLRFFAPPADTGTGGDDPADKPGDDPADKPEDKPADKPAGDDADKGKKLEDLSPEELRGIITDLRRENAGKRTTARDAAAEADVAKTERDAITQAVVKALGIELPGDEKPTIESLQEALAAEASKATASDSAAADLKRENAVLRYAAGLNANGDALLDSRAFVTKLSTVDPSDAEAVKAAITAALAENSGFALVRVPGSSGGTEHTGGDSTDRAKSMREAASKRLGFTQ